ncbi:MAG: alcohol dehydrogenase catalytic domain-containing protein [Caldilineaceae bacterium]|nr:alcohol dehydrogenase catalytic domain-containing protein [Caldilineaceae bacterium]
MQAIVLTDEGVRLCNDYPDPQPTPQEALIRVRLAGVCATDLQLIAGYKGGYRGILGHEFVGDVIAAPGHPQWEGQRVVGEINHGCGVCELCQRGLGKHCRQRQSLGIIKRDGAFATYLTLPVANLHAVPPEMPDEVAVFTEPAAAALQIREQISIAPDSRVYLLGDGRLGMLVAQVIALTGCELTVLGRHQSKLAMLAQLPHPWRLGVNTPTLRAELAQRPADIVIEVTGSAQGFAQASALVRPGGTLVLKSTFAESIQDFNLSHLVVDEVTVIGSRCGPFAPALRLLNSNLLQVRQLIQAHYPLAQGVDALAHASRRGVLKVLLQPMG